MLGEELIALHENPRLVPRFTDHYPGTTPAAGYAAARKLHEHRLAKGWKPVGRKIGFTNRILWDRYGVREPIWGTVYDRTLIRADRDRATLPLAGVMQPRIEPEVSFKLKAAPQSSEPDELLSCIEWMAHSVEVVQCHHPDWKFALADCTANNGLHGRLVLGTPVPIPAKLKDALPKMAVRLYNGERLVDEGVGANVLGSPLLALAHFVKLLERQPESPPLAAGEIVTTGSLTDAHLVAPGETWRTELSGLSLKGMTISFE